MLAMDIETYDPNLKELGDGAIRKDGRILCCGVYGTWKDKKISKVLDFDNPVDIQMCRDIMLSDEPKIFHNGIYDLSWLCCGYDMILNGIVHDTMTRAALIDEYAPLGLDECCKRFGLQGKNKNETIDAWYEQWRDRTKGLASLYKQKKLDLQELSSLDRDAIINKSYNKTNIWSNALTVWADESGRQAIKKYNLQDCIATYNLFYAQESRMGIVQDVYVLECKLIPILIKMKKVGIRIDEKRLLELSEKVNNSCIAAEKKLVDMYGITGEMIASSKKLGSRLNEMGIYSPVITATGNQSWSADVISRINHPVVPMIEEYKSYVALRDKYLQGSLTKTIVNGRIHCTFYPMLREDAGTVTGRFSCKSPNLQQIPARNKGHGTDYSQDMRSLFLPEEGQMLAADDYSQIEYLLLCHFAVGDQAEWFRQQAKDGVDFHKVAMSATGITYRPVVKTFNYGVIYGMGWKTAMIKNYALFEKLAKEHGLDIETFTKNIYNDYHKKLPVIKDTMNYYQNIAKQQGYITTLGGRIAHKPKPAYDPVTCKINDFLYKMLNKLIQGTAADILKQSLITAYDEGIYDVLTLHLLVHDEQVNSVPFNKVGTEAAVRLQEIMADVYKDRLLVPMKAECELGPNWGYWSDDIYNEMKKGNFDQEFFNKDYKETA